MRITFTQSGGFAGLLKHCSLDAGSLAADERREIESLVRASGLTESWERFAAAARDLKHYEIEIDRDGGSVRVCCDDRCLPVAARPLVAFLAARSTPGPPPAARAAADGPRGAGGDWGRFVGAVVARWHDDGRSMTLVEPFAYVDPRDARWDAPAGSVVNGASIPRAFWTAIGGPFEGRFRDASVVHDVACEERSRAWQNVHRMFYEACRCGGVDAVTAKVMYYAVSHFGPRWRIEERRSVVAGRVVTERVAVTVPAPRPPPGIEGAVARWFVAHDVDAEAIPALPVPPGG
ncbi:MAG: protealysin inhibitor emfourin [Planctomycetaceae bacterium]